MHDNAQRRARTERAQRLQDAEAAQSHARARAREAADQAKAQRLQDAEAAVAGAAAAPPGRQGAGALAAAAALWIGLWLFGFVYTAIE
jgi:hypothetical protein